jgi:hypothetical protein
MKSAHLSTGSFVLSILLLSAVPLVQSSAQTAPVQRTQRNQRFPDAGESPIAGWQGPIFHLSQDYPRLKPAPRPQPWKKYDFTNEDQWQDYLNAVLRYCLEGNVEVDWDASRNKIRGWYHAPWMHWGPNGREFIHGLTHERVSLPGELAPSQKSMFQNWAVGMYNAPGGWIIGRIWRNHDRPNLSALRSFPDGTVSIKLLFTQATVKEVPYLAGSKEWDAYIYDKTEFPVNPNGTRSIQKLRLLQVDIAVRDDRNDKNTGWVFGTFTYNGKLSANSVYDKLVPIGIMWGNDPQAKAATDKITETFINRSSDLPTQHLGWNGRLDGPVDNPMSSCLSCHSTSQWPVLAPLIPPKSAPLGSNEWMVWFRNVKAGTPFSSGAHSLDYSLQLGTGLQNFYEWQRIVGDLGGADNSHAVVQALGFVATSKQAVVGARTYKISRAPDQEH